MRLNSMCIRCLIDKQQAGIANAERLRQEYLLFFPL